VRVKQSKSQQIVAKAKLAQIWRDLRDFARNDSTCGSNRGQPAQLRQGKGDTEERL
jgi:hypothetical protein